MKIISGIIIWNVLVTQLLSSAPPHQTLRFKALPHPLHTNLTTPSSKKTNASEYSTKPKSQQIKIDLTSSQQKRLSKQISKIITKDSVQNNTLNNNKEQQQQGQQKSYLLLNILDGVKSWFTGDFAFMGYQPVKAKKDDKRFKKTQQKVKTNSTAVTKQTQSTKQKIQDKSKIQEKPKVQEKQKIQEKPKVQEKQKIQEKPKVQDQQKIQEKQRLQSVQRLQTVQIQQNKQNVKNKLQTIIKSIPLPPSTTEQKYRLVKTISKDSKNISKQEQKQINNKQVQIQTSNKQEMKQFNSKQDTKQTNNKQKVNQIQYYPVIYIQKQRYQGAKRK